MSRCILQTLLKLSQNCHPELVEETTTAKTTTYHTFSKDFSFAKLNHLEVEQPL